MPNNYSSCGGIFLFSTLLTIDLFDSRHSTGLPCGAEKYVKRQRRTKEFSGTSSR